LQFLTEPELALILAATYAGVVAAWVCLLVTLLMKTKRTPLYHVPGGGGTRGFTIFNATLASLLLATTGCVAFYSARQWVRLRLRRRLRWADRSRAVAAAQRQALVGAYVLNAVAYLAPNAYALARPCALFSPVIIWLQLVRWLCLAVILADVALLALQSWWLARFPDDDVPFDADAADARDASPWTKLPLGVKRYASALWANGGVEGGDGRGRDALLWQWALRAAPLAAVFSAQVGVVIALAVVTAREPLPAQPCSDGAAFVALCRRDGLLLRPARRGLLIAHVCLTAAYAFLFVAYLYLASRALRGQPYDRSRRRRIALRFLLWSSSKALLTAVAAVAISLLVGIDSCETRALADYGFAPLQIVLAVYTAAHTYCLAPATAGEERGRHVLLEQLQLFAWREEEVPGVAAMRNADAPKAAWAEPVFCVETACKLFSWSWAAYECGNLAGGADLRAGGGDEANATLLVRPLGPRLRDADDSGAPLPGDVPLAAEVAALQRRRRSRWHRLRMLVAACMPLWEKEARAAEAAAQSNGGGSSWPGWDPRAMAAHAGTRVSSWGRQWMMTPQRRPHDEETADDAASSGDENDADADVAAHAADEAHAGGASGADAAAVADAAALATVVMSRRAARRARARVLLPRLLSLYGQRGAWVFSESRRDTRALLAWGPDAIVLAFRGSASAENFRTDAALALVTHPPRRRVRLPRSLGAPLRSHTPAVHSGFWRAYTAGGLRAALLAKLGALTSAAAASGAPLRLFCTGHSLGGALATLAAFDAAAACGLPRDAVTVVTFGAPRVGNHAFATDLDAAVPSCWNVVLGRDAVFRGAKLGGAYKHPGKRVALKRQGTLLVRPSFIESSFSRGGGALGDHLLRRYEAALETLARRPEAAEHADALRECLLYADGVLPKPADAARPPETATPPAHAALE
jgi:hypothetical protein